MILLSFDIEEFDLPIEYQQEISFEDQIKISSSGTKKILRILDQQQIKATFYCTANFAIHNTQLVENIVAQGHELASHGFFHSTFEEADLKKSKDKLENLFKVPVLGYRMARMQAVSDKAVARAGYQYNSSLNPTYLPGRYNKLNEPRTWFYRDGVWQLPASVSPIIRFPLFWLSFHNLPSLLYRLMCQWTIRQDSYLNVYFHPWEFESIGSQSPYKFPAYVTHNSGSAMEKRLEQFIIWAKLKNYRFLRTIDFINTQCNKQ